MNAPIPTLNQIEGRDTIDLILEAISAIDHLEFMRVSRRDDVMALSSNTIFDALEVNPEAIFRKPDGGFEASGVIYITLNYGGNRDPVSMPDSYPAVVRGTLSNDIAKITEIEADTSSFYE